MGLIDNNKAGICWIAFRKSISDDDIQELINDFYLKNCASIEGMEFSQIVDVATMRKAKRLAINSLKEGSQ